MYGGRIAEYGNREQIFKNMTHPYTKLLFSSIPKLEKQNFLLDTIPGVVPSATDYNEGCRFLDRCPAQMEICKDESISHVLTKGHQVTCHLLDKGINSKWDLNSQKKTIPQNQPSPLPLISVKNLETHFPVKKGVFLRTVNHIRAVDNVNMEIPKGSTLAIVGESGCGKSTTARLLIGLIEPDQGEVIFNGQEVGAPDGISLRDMRRNTQIVFQDSYSSLNPRLPIEETIAFGPIVHGVPRDKARERARDILAKVGLEPNLFIRRYPHMLSGGQRQRINIARALALEPSVVLLDEPVSAIDKSVEAQVLNLLNDLKTQLQLTYVFISHDLNVVQYLSDRVLVMYLGKIIELGPVDRIYNTPQHPYSKALLSAMPSMDPDQRISEVPLSGDPPNPINPPPGCRFHTRCVHAEAICMQKEPPLREFKSGTGHFSACHMTTENSGYSDMTVRQELEKGGP